MLGVRIEAGRELERFLFGLTLERYDVRHDRLAVRQGPCLIDGHRLESVPLLKVRASLDQHPRPRR